MGQKKNNPPYFAIFLKETGSTFHSIGVSTPPARAPFLLLKWSSHKATLSRHRVKSHYRVSQWGRFWLSCSRLVDLRRANSPGGRSGIPGPPFWKWDPFFSARARANVQATVGAQGFPSPLDQQRVGRPGRWAAARAPAPCSRAPFCIQAPACPRSQSRKGDEL